MSSFRSREGAALSVLTTIIRGEAWTASSVRNPILRKNYRRLNRVFCRSNSITDSLRESSLRLFVAALERSALLSSANPLGRELVSVLIRISSYSHRWIRPPESWVPAGGDVVGDLLRHLFVKWEVPAFFEAAWLAKGELSYLERDWYCDLAVGKSWRKLEKVPASMTSRAIHRALQAPRDLSIRQALRWGQLMTMGADGGLIEQVLESAVVQNLSNDEIWFRLLEKVVAAENFDPRDFGMMADYFQMLYQRSQYFRARDLVGVPLGELRRHCRVYWQRLLDDAVADGLNFDTHDLAEAGLRRELLTFTMAVWEPMKGVRDEEIYRQSKPGETIHWKIIQLVRHSQLFAEALAMKHCVDGYRRACQKGYSAIFSLGQVDLEGRVRSRVTIEVCRKRRWLIQTRAKWNESPGEEELQILYAWAMSNDLKMW